jgi:DNA repair exonuclease SbcCD ATPase subunit
MSDDTYTTPFSTAFEMQRSAIKQSQQAMESSVEFQKRAGAAMLDGLDTTEEAQRQTVEMAENGIHSYLDTLESSMPGTTGIDQLRGNVETTFESLYEAHAEAFEAAEGEFEKGIDAYDDMAIEYLEAVNEQMESLLEAHAESEQQVMSAFERAESQFEEMQGQFEEQGEEMQARFQEQFDQFQAQLEEMQERIEEVQHEAVSGLEA